MSANIAIQKENTSEKQKNTRRSTKFDGVTMRDSATRRFQGKPDVCYDIDYYVGGKRKREKVGWKSEGYSIELARNIRAERIQQARHSDTATIQSQKLQKTTTLNEAFSLYHKDWLLARQKACAYFDANIFKNHIAPAIGTLSLHEITQHNLDTMAAVIASRGLSAQLQKHAIALVRRIIRKMRAWGKFDGKNIFENYKLPTVNNARTRFLTPKEAQDLLLAVRKRSEHVWLMSLISLSCGLRFGEIAALTVADYNVSDGIITIRDSKAGKTRHAFVSGVCAAALGEWIACMDIQAGLIFPNRNGVLMREIGDSFNRTVTALGLNTGITDNRQKVVFHTLRHTFASWLAMNGTQQFLLSELMGHASLEMTKRYTHLGDAAKRAAICDINAILHKN